MKIYLMLYVIALAAVSANTAFSEESEKDFDSSLQGLLQNIQAEMNTIPEASQESVRNIVEMVLELVEMSLDDSSDFKTQLEEIFMSLDGDLDQKHLRSLKQNPTTQSRVWISSYIPYKKHPSMGSFVGHEYIRGPGLKQAKVEVKNIILSVLKRKALKP